MALSGYVDTGSYQGRYYRVSWTAKQSIDSNQSTISWTLEALGGTSSWYAERTLEVALGGSSVYSKSARVERYKGTIASGTKVISHDSSGNASFSIGIRAAVYTSSVNCTGSKTFTLNTIPRKSTLSVGNGTLNAEQTLNVTRLSTSFTHTIVATCGSESKTICTKSTSTSIKFTPPIDWASQNKTGTSVTVKYTITTYNGNTSIGSNTYTKTCSIPASVKPSVTFTVEEATSLELGVYVQGQSKLKIAITPTLSYGSAIASYKTTVDGKTYTSSSFTTDVLNGNGSLTITVTIKDKRGRTATEKMNITVLAYESPQITELVIRRSDKYGTSNSQGEYLAVDYSVNVASLNNLNSARYYLWYKKTSETSWTVEELTSISGAYVIYGLTTTFKADKSSSYDVRIVAEDNFYNGDTAIYKTGKGTTALKTWSLFRKGLGIALGKIAELENVFDIGFRTRFYGGILLMTLENGTDVDSLKTTNTYKVFADDELVNMPEDGVGGILKVYSSDGESSVQQQFMVSSKTNPRTYERAYFEGAWGGWICPTAPSYIIVHIPTATTVAEGSVIPFVQEGIRGNGFTVNDEGRVVVGKGVNYVRITARIGGNAPCGRCWAFISRNGVALNNTGSAIAYGDYMTASADTIIQVYEGDEIAVYVGEEFHAKAGGVKCFMIVEKIG